MITAHHHEYRGFLQHNHRAGVMMNVEGEGDMWVVHTRLDNKKVQAHAWCMVVAWGILLPMGIIWARYFRVGAPPQRRLLAWSRGFRVGIASESLLCRNLWRVYVQSFCTVLCVHACIRCA